MREAALTHCMRSSEAFVATAPETLHGLIRDACSERFTGAGRADLFELLMTHILRGLMNLLGWLYSLGLRGLCGPPYSA